MTKIGKIGDRTRIRFEIRAARYYFSKNIFELRAGRRIFFRLGQELAGNWKEANTIWLEVCGI